VVHAAAQQLHGELIGGAPAGHGLRLEGPLQLAIVVFVPPPAGGWGWHARWGVRGEGVPLRSAA
jgi:hypothetical protein